MTGYVGDYNRSGKLIHLANKAFRCGFKDMRIKGIPDFYSRTEVIFTGNLNGNQYSEFIEVSEFNDTIQTQIRQGYDVVFRDVFTDTCQKEVSK